MEVKRRKIFTSKPDWFELLWFWILGFAGTFAVLLALLPDADAATAAPCDGRHYVHKLVSGGSVLSIESVSDACIDLQLRLVKTIEDGFSYTGTPFPVAPSTCSTDPLVTGSTMQYVYNGSTTVTWNVTQLCKPVDVGVTADYAIQDILVLCASVILFGIGFNTGQQR